MFNLGGTRVGNTAGAPISAPPGNIYGRVVDVVLDNFHPKYDTYGKSQSLNGVIYRPITDTIEEEGDVPLDFAYCLDKNLHRIPVKGEIVLIVTRLSEERTASITTEKPYWSSVVPLWNHPHHNAYPDTKQNGEGDNDFGDNFEEKDNIAPLQAFPGDVIIEGRHGQSIRFNATKYDSNEIVTDDNNGDPTILISNGQKEAPNSLDPVIEDINEDPSSIYLTSNHTIALEQANEKRDAFEEEPDKADSYEGSQVIINGGRLYFNAKEEGAFISSKEMIGLNSKIIGIDADDTIGLDANKIYLGTGAFEESEPALKGETSTTWLDDLVSILEALANTMATTPPAPPTYIGGLVKEGVKMKAQLPKLKSLLTKLHSKKVFIDKK